MGFSSNFHIKLIILDHIYFVAQNVKLTLTWWFWRMGVLNLQFWKYDYSAKKQNKAKTKMHGDHWA